MSVFQDLNAGLIDRQTKVSMFVIQNPVQTELSGNNLRHTKPGQKQKASKGLGYVEKLVNRCKTKWKLTE